MSNDFLESDLPKPELSLDDKDFPEELPFLNRWSSCFGGANFLMFTTLSTIFVPIKTGFTSSPPMECPLLRDSTEFPLLLALPFRACPLEGEHDCRLGLLIELDTVEEY